MLSDRPVWITEEIAMSGPVPMNGGFERVADTLFLLTEQGFVPDPLEDDQALFLKTDRGLVIVLGCAHRGLINTLALARRLTGMERIHLVLGGTHLHAVGPETLERTIEALEAFRVEHLGVSHCTGSKAAVRLFQAFGERFFFNHAGMSLRLPLS